MEDYGVARGYLELDMSNLDSNVKSAIKCLDDLERKGALAESEFNKLQSETTKIGGVFQQAAQKSKALSGQIDQAKQKCGLYESEIKALNTIIDQAKNKQNEWSTKIKDAESAQERAEKKLENLSDAYKSVQQEIKTAAKEYGNNSTQVKELEEKHSGLIKSYKNAETALVSSRNTLVQYRNEQEACGIEIEQSGRRIVEFKTKLNNTQAAINRMSVELAQAQSKAMQFGEVMQGAGEKLQNIGGVLDGWGNKLTMAVTTPLVSAGTASVKLAADAESSFAKVSTIADQTVLSYEDMESGVKKASNNTGVAITDFNEALYSSLSAGVETGKAIGFTTDMVKLAKGGFTDTAKAVDVVTSVLNAYGLSADQASSISDKLITTQNIGKTTVDELASSLGRVIPTAKAFGVDMDNVSTSMAILTKRGIQTAEATTYYNSMLNELGKSGSVADNALRELSGKGFSQLIAEGTPVTDVLQMLSDKAAENGQSLSDMFGSMEAGKAALSIMSDGGVEYNHVLEEMRNSAGATQEAFDKMDATSAAKMQKELNKLKNAGIEAGTQLLPVVTDVVKEVGNLAEKFSELSPKQQQTIIKTAALAAGMGPALKAAGSLTGGLGKLTKGLGGVIENAGKAKALKTVEKGMEGVGKATSVASKGTGVMTAAMSALTSPVGIAVTSIAALTGGIYLASKAEKERIETLGRLTGKEKELADAIDEQHESYVKMAEHRESSLESIDAETARTQNLADELRTLVDENGRVKAGNEDRVAYVLGELSEALGQEMSLTDGVVQGYENINASIDETIQRKKALAIQEALQDDYTEAIMNQSKAQESYNEQLKNTETNQRLLSEAQANLTAVDEAYNYGIGITGFSMDEYNRRYAEAKEQVEIYTEKLKNSNQALEEAEEDLVGYNETIQNYEGLGAALEGDAEQVNLALLKIQEGFQTAVTGTKESLEKQKETIQEKYEEMAEALANSASGVTQEAVDQMKALADQADSELAAKIDQDKQTLTAKFKECGIEAPQGMIDTLAEKSPEMQASLMDMLSSMSAGTALKKEEIKNILETLGIESTEGLIASLSEKKPYVQAEAIDLLAQLQSAEESKRPDIISQLKELGIKVDGSLAEGVEENKQKVTDASGVVAKEGVQVMQDTFAKRTLNPPNVDGIDEESYLHGLSGNMQMGTGLKSQNLTPPDVSDINDTTKNIGVAGNASMGSWLISKNLEPPKVNDIDGTSVAERAHGDMQSYLNNNPLSVVVNVAKKVGGAIGDALGFANGGIATEPSIFGEDGPEMAIPLSVQKRSRAIALYEQTGDILGISRAESEMRREALNSFSASYQVERRWDTGDIVFNAPEIDYDLLAKKISDALRSSPIQPVIEMKDGDVYLDNERVGRKQAPVISRIMSQNI